MFDHYKAQLELFWTVEEAVFTPDDRSQYDNLSENEKHFINHVLGFFAAADSIVNENLAIRFYKDI